MKFRERWKKSTQQDWDFDNGASAQTFIRGCGRKVFRRLRRIQKESVESGEVNNWDITTLIEILLHVKFYPNQSLNEEEMHYLEELRDVRNKVMHNPDERLSTEIADQLWVRLESILSYFGVTVEKIHETKNSSGVITHLDHEKENSSKVCKNIPHKNGVQF